MDNGGNIVNYTAKAVSVFLHPAFLPVYGLLLIFNTPSLLVYLPANVKRIIFFMVLINNVILPLALLPVLRYRNIISSWELESRNERIIPLLTASLMYFVTAVMVYRLQLPGLIKAFMFASACVVFATALLNFRWKISVHSVGAGAMVATILVMSFKMYNSEIWLVVAVFLLSGLVMTARLWLRVHTPDQVFTGFLAGLLVMALSMLI